MCCHHTPTGCCCTGHGHAMGVRRFLSKEEKIDQLRKYAEDLEKELSETKKRIKSLQEDDKNHHCCCC